MAARIAAFVVPLGLDTFALAVALGLRKIPMLRLALLFPIFEVSTPLAGIAAGYFVSRLVEDAAVYIGALILIGIGIHTLRDALTGEDESGTLNLDSMRGIILAGFAISTDEIAMGFPLGALRLPLGPVLLAIAIQTFVVTIVGISIGRRMSRAVGRRASRVSGAVAGAAFVALGAYLALEKLLSAPFG